MYKFTLSTDSTCDLYHDFLVENDIPCAPLSFTLDKDGVIEDCLDNFTEYSQYVDFYNKIRAGAMPKTSILNYESHYKHFKKLAENGAGGSRAYHAFVGTCPYKGNCRASRG